VAVLTSPPLYPIYKHRRVDTPALLPVFPTYNSHPYPPPPLLLSANCPNGYPHFFLPTALCETNFNPSSQPLPKAFLTSRTQNISTVFLTGYAFSVSLLFPQGKSPPWLKQRAPLPAIERLHLPLLPASPHYSPLRSRFPFFPHVLVPCRYGVFFLRLMARGLFVYLL